MDGFDPAASFGPDVASRYDESPRGDEGETVVFPLLTLPWVTLELF